MITNNDYIDFSCCFATMKVHGLVERSRSIFGGEVPRHFFYFDSREEKFVVWIVV